MSIATSYFIGARYTFSKRRNGFLSFVSTFAIGGMALGVFALVVVLSVMNGFDRELKERILRAIPHATIQSKSDIEDWQRIANEITDIPGFVAASPWVGGNALLAKNGRVKGVSLQGVDPSEDSRVSPVASFMTAGHYDALQPNEFGIVLGSLLAFSIGAQVGDKVTVTLPKVSVTLAGVFPRSREFTVVGVFEVGAQVDESLAMIHLASAQKLFRTGNSVSGIRLKFENLYMAPQGAAEIQTLLGESVTVTDWSQTQGSLFKAVKLEKTVTGILLGIIIAVAAFNIITSLIMMVTEKKSDIAVLRTMGMTRKQVMNIFIFQGSITAFWGIAVGLFLGIPCALYLPDIIAFFEDVFRFQVFDENVYFVTSIPSLWMFSDTFIVAASAVIMSFLATLYPAYRASKIEPAEAMRYDQ